MNYKIGIEHLKFSGLSSDFDHELLPKRVIPYAERIKIIEGDRENISFPHCLDQECEKIISSAQKNSSKFAHPTQGLLKPIGKIQDSVFTPVVSSSTDQLTTGPALKAETPQLNASRLPTATNVAASYHVSQTPSLKPDEQINLSLSQNVVKRPRITANVPCMSMPLLSITPEEKLGRMKNLSVAKSVIQVTI